MKEFKWSLVIMLLILSSFGCTPRAVAPVFFIPKDIEMAPEALVQENLLIKVSLSENDVDPYITANNFRIALEEAIKRANLFGGDVDKTYTLTSSVYKASFPSSGFTMSSELCAKYALMDFFSKEVWSKDICYKGEATTGEAFFGATRALLAFNRANHGHVTLLITSLKDHLEKMRKRANQQ
jgi:hypothetical protein